MLQAPTFAFRTSAGPGPLMDELEKFLVFWLGAHRSEYCEPVSDLGGKDLPGPLRRPYAFAGRWQQPNPETDKLTWVLNAGKGFRRLEGLERNERGSLFFADECQANWSCATKTRGTDPPV